MSVLDGEDDTLKIRNIDLMASDVSSIGAV